jgi:hypothetical protein
MFSPHPWIIRGLDFREPLHAGGVDFGDPVFELGALDLFLNLAIPQNTFKGDELPLLKGFGELTNTRVLSRVCRDHSWRTSEIVIQLETPSLTNVFEPCLPTSTEPEFPSIVSPEVGPTFRCVPPTTAQVNTWRWPACLR